MEAEGVSESIVGRASLRKPTDTISMTAAGVVGLPQWK